MVLNLAVLIWLVSPLFTVFVPLPAVWLPAAEARTPTASPAHRSTWCGRYRWSSNRSLGWLGGKIQEVRAAYGMKPYPEDPGTWRGMS